MNCHAAQPEPQAECHASGPASAGAAANATGARPTLLAAENAADAPVASALVQLLSGQILRDGELVELVIRPSIWWVVFTSWRWVGVCVIVAMGGWMLSTNPALQRPWVEAMVLTALGRVVWALLRWMSRLHILTSLRVITISGVFNACVYECPLRKLARVRQVSAVRERLLMLGSLELIPSEEQYPIDTWQTIARPKLVYEKLCRAMQRAREGPGNLAPGA